MCLPCWAKQCPHEEHFNCYQNGYGFKASFSPEEIVDRMICRAKKLNQYVDAQETFQIRITGGEPLLSKHRWNHVAEILNILDDRLDPEEPHYSKTLDNRLHGYGKRNGPKKKRLVIQTNGISLGKVISANDFMQTVKSLTQLNILVHHSMKGCKPVEFHLLTGADETLFNRQIESIGEFEYLSKSIDNFDFQIVLGFFHSQKYILWNPEEKEPMLTEPDSSFLGEVKRNWERTFAEPLDFRSRMINNARTTERCFEKGIVKERSQLKKSTISELEPLPCPGKKTMINGTFWRKLT
ncbi:MAG: hypothetical protein ABSD73_08235 [Candidatus Bathyarchaeia archaeon]|jgi:uncharacterized Fe-S cluster-containing radical SAM superfamily protein